MLRSIAATAALASVALGPAATAQTAVLAGPPGAEVEVEADRITYVWDPRVIRLEGHVVARRGGGLLRAGSGLLDRPHGILKLEGGVLGVQGRQVFLADAAIVDLNARTAELTKAVLFLKQRAPNPDAPRAGPNALILRGSRVRQLPEGRYVAEKVTLTPCDCAGEPDYELIAETAEIDGDRAHLRGVDLHLLGATLPLFPLSLPLTSRQNGLLAPQIGFGAPIGFAFAQPIFLTLGPSHDVTLTPGWYTGGRSHQQLVLGERSVKGPRLGLEWRYAPVEGTGGSLALDLYRDLDESDSTARAAAFPGERGTSAGRGFGGVRGVARVAHRTEGSAGIFAVQGTIASDVMAVRDPATQSVENYAVDLLATHTGFWRARGPLTLGLASTLIQDMRVDGAAPDRRLFGPERRTTFQRLPAAFAQIAPIALGQATVSLEASVAQFTRFAGPDPQEQAFGFAPTDHGAPQAVATGTPLPYDGSRAPALRLDLSPRVGLAGPRSFPVDLRLEAGARVDGWIVEGFPERDRTRAYALLGARAAMPLERRYGSALHRIEPALEVRVLSRSLQSGGPPFGDLTDGGGQSFAAKPDAAQQGLGPDLGVAGVPAARRTYDEIDFAAPVTGAVEATASVSQSLWTRPGRTPGRILRFDVLQDALLWVGGGKARLGEGSAIAAAQLGPGGVQGVVRYDWALRYVSAFSASAGVRDGRGDEVHASIGMLRGSSSERLRAGIDELFSASRLAAVSTPLTGSAGAGASGPLPRGLRLSYELTYTPGDIPATLANWVHATALTLETTCRCAGLQILARAPFHGAHLLRSPEVSVLIDLKSLGSFATF